MYCVSLGSVPGGDTETSYMLLQRGISFTACWYSDALKIRVLSNNYKVCSLQLRMSAEPRNSLWPSGS